MIRHVRPLDDTVLLRNTPGFPSAVPRGRGEARSQSCMPEAWNEWPTG